MKKNGEFVGVNEKFIPEEEKYVDESILGNKAETEEKIKSFAKKGGNIAKKIGIGYLIFIGFLIAFFIGMFIFIGSSIFKVGKTINKTGQVVYEQIDNLSNGNRNNTSFIENIGTELQNQMNTQEVDSFNKTFELYSGTGSKLFVTTLLDKVITNNKKK